MTLFYYRPRGHGPASLFVAAESALEAAMAVNAYRAKSKESLMGTPIDTYRYGDREFCASDFRTAEPGEVIENDND